MIALLFGKDCKSALFHEFNTRAGTWYLVRRSYLLHRDACQGKGSTTMQGVLNRAISHFPTNECTPRGHILS